jgi:hypothetical protein
VVSVPVSAVSVWNTWQIKVGSEGVNGMAKFVAFGSGTGSIVLTLAKLKASTLVGGHLEGNL